MAPWTTADIPSLVGRTAVVTGANAGLGLAVTEALRNAGATVVMGCRSVERGELARASLPDPDPDPDPDPAPDPEPDPDSNRDPAAGGGGGTGDREAGSLTVAELDLADPASIGSFADRFLDEHGELDLLVNNAGIMAVPGRLTSAGVQSQWAVNHLGPFALTGRLLPAFIDRPARIVAVSSLAAASGRLDDVGPTDLDGYRRFPAYANSKLANQVYAVELNLRLRAAGSDAISVAAHPGISHTRLATSTGLGPLTPVVLGLSRLMAQSAADGALPILRAGTDPGVEGGQYYGPGGGGQRRGPPKQVLLIPGVASRSLGRRLWERSVALSGVDYLSEE